MRRLMLLVLVIAWTMGPLTVAAHEKFRIVGTLVKCLPTELVIKTKDGHRFTVFLDEKTVYQRDRKKIAKPVLEPGQSVVVDALGDAEDDLGAVVVNIVPAIKPSPTPKSTPR
jgi:hypothetical protein